MSSPVQLNIVISLNNAGTITTSTVVVPIPAALQSLDSGQQASQQTGFSAVSTLVNSIFKSRVFFVPSANTWYPVDVIQSITWS